jgi:hypothetical protein
VVGAGGEVALGNRSRFIDTVCTPDMVTVDAAERRMELAAAAGALALGLDAAASAQTQNSLERALAHQLGAAHVAAMELQAEARELLQRYKRAGYTD